MAKLSLADFGFVALESAESPKHVGGLQVYELPKDAKPDFEAIDELMVGGVEEWDRAELLLATASQAMRLEDAKRVARTIREYQSRFPRDARILVFAAGLQKLAGEPIDRPPSEDDR